MIKKRGIYRLGIGKLWWVESDIGGLGNEYDGPLHDWIVDSPAWLKHCKKHDVVVQAGGMCGLYPLLYSRKFTTVYTFEPSPHNFSCLARNCEKPGIIKLNCALGDENKTLSIFDGIPNNVGMHKMDYSTPGSIPVIKIDQLGLNACDLIHLDIEGAESKALLGGIETIKKYYPTIILEHCRGEEVIIPLGYKKVYQGTWDGVYVKN